MPYIPAVLLDLARSSSTTAVCHISNSIYRLYYYRPLASRGHQVVHSARAGRAARFHDGAAVAAAAALGCRCTGVVPERGCAAAQLHSAHVRRK